MKNAKDRLTSDERKALASHVKRMGMVVAAKFFRCNRGTIANALAEPSAGLSIQTGTVVLLRQKLSELASVGSMDIMKTDNSKKAGT